MTKCNLHTHSTFCDGCDELEKTVLSAIKLGFDSLGFSGHSYTDFDLRYCMSKEDTGVYILKINDLEEKYKDKIEIYCGLEKDYYSCDNNKFDYKIGSVHYFMKDGKFHDVDASEEELLNAVNDFYNGDIYSCIEDYFSTVANLKRKTNCDIIGHFDLIKKFNYNNSMFDDTDKRYVNSAIGAVTQLLNEEVIFEYNTSGMRKNVKQMYPADFILKEIAQKKGKVIITSDCHSCELLDYGFDDAKEKLISLGFKSVVVLSGGKFIEQKI